MSLLIVRRLPSIRWQPDDIEADEQLSLYVASPKEIKRLNTSHSLSAVRYSTLSVVSKLCERKEYFDVFVLLKRLTFYKGIEHVNYILAEHACFCWMIERKKIFENRYIDEWFIN